MSVTTNVGPAAPPDDSALINLVLTGNAECFGVLMDRHLATVRGRIRGMTRCPSDADDIMQEVQLKIWKHLGSYRSDASFRTWMTRVAINEAIQFSRKVNRVPLVHMGIELAELISPSESPLQPSGNSAGTASDHPGSQDPTLSGEGRAVKGAA
jgi:DNA-directed RNA polymerase specialized sigma24 family protein